MSRKGHDHSTRKLQVASARRERGERERREGGEAGGEDGREEGGIGEGQNIGPVGCQGGPL